MFMSIHYKITRWIDQYPGVLIKVQPWPQLHRLMLLQVEMYFPESGHPAFGIFRAIVKDSTDVNHGAASVVRVAPCCFPEPSCATSQI